MGVMEDANQAAADRAKADQDLATAQTEEQNAATEQARVDAENLAAQANPPASPPASLVTAGNPPVPAPNTFGVFLTDGSRVTGTTDYATQPSAQSNADSYATAHPGTSVLVKDSTGAVVGQAFVATAINQTPIPNPPAPLPAPTPGVVPSIPVLVETSIAKDAITLADAQAKADADAKAKVKPADTSKTPFVPTVPDPHGDYEFFYCLSSSHPGATDLVADERRIFAVKINPKTGPLTGPPFCPVCQKQVNATLIYEFDDQGEPQIPASIVALGERLNAPVNI